MAAVKGRDVSGLMNALGRGIIAARVGTAALNAASVPPRQLARPVSIVPNIPGIPGPPSSSSGSVSPPGLPVHSEAKMVSVAPHPLRPLRSARAAPSAKAFFPRDFCKELLRNQSPVPGWDRLSGSAVGVAAALPGRGGAQRCWDGAQRCTALCAELRLAVPR